MSREASSPAQGPSGLDPARRDELRQAKLRGLVTTRWGPEVAAGGVAGSFPGGATLRTAEGDGRGWVLVEEHMGRSLGAALVWARRAGVASLHLLVTSGAGILARRAQHFASPPQVWTVDGRTLSQASPEPYRPPPDLPVGAAALADVIRGAGAEAVVEHGALRAEVRGLEVARAVGPPGGAPDSGGWRLEVGVGRYDREATQALRGDEDPAVTLARAVAQVDRERRAGVPSHPANQLARERWLRAVLLDRPDLVGVTALMPVDPPTPAPDLTTRAVAPALGEDGDGEAVVVVCSTGVDPDLVPQAADARGLQEALLNDGCLRLVLVVPERDDLPVTRALASALSRPADVRPVPTAWQGLGRT